jgi:WD40 repeat protein
VYLAFSPDDKELARVSSFGHVLLDTRTWSQGRAFDVGVRMVAYSPDGKTIVTAEGTDGARSWNASTKGKPVPGGVDEVTQVSVLSAPKRVLITRDEGKSQRVFAAGFSADAARFFTTDAAGHVKIWQTGTGTLETDIAQTTSPVHDAAFHPNGKLIAFGDEAGVLHVFDLASKKSVRDVTTPAPIAHVEYSHDGTRVLTVHAGGTAMIWDPISWKAQVEEGVQAGAFSPDATLLALGGRDVRLLVPKTGETSRTIAVPACAITALAWRHDGHQLAVACMQGSVRLFAVP